MPDYTEITHRGWLSRLGGAFKGIFAGIVFLVIALGLQFWNEGRTQKRDSAIGEGRAAVVAADANAVAPGNEGRLVHITGEAKAGAALGDPAFGVQVGALALRRRVEMYQWEEKRESREEKQVGGGTRTVTEYRYRKDWNDEPIDSSDFRQAGAHANPGPLPYENQTWRADDVRVGGYTLSPAASDEIGGWERVGTDSVELPPNLAASFRVDDGWFVTSEDSNSPQVGDVRVRFEYVPEGVISVIARQQNGVLVPYAASNGNELLLVERGASDATAMFEAEGSRNATAAWFLRLAGFVLAWVAFAMLLKPLVVMADVLPIAGRLAGVGVGLVSGVLAAIVSIVAIGSGWLFYRPWLLVVIVVVIVGVAMWLVRRRATAVPSDSTASIPPPPPPPAA